MSSIARALALTLTLVVAALGPSRAHAVEDLLLKTTRGKRFFLSDMRSTGVKLRAFAFLGTTCPVANSYVPKLNEIQAKFRDRGVQVFGVYPQPSDNLNEIAHHGNEFDVRFNVIRDWEGKLTQTLGADRLSQVVLVDADLKVLYSGQIDDQYSIENSRPTVGSDDLVRSITEALTGRAPQPARTVASGCIIPRATAKPATRALTYSNHAGPILEKRCHSCHRAGGIAPFALESYADAAAWAPMIREVVLEERMPPWHADARGLPLANSRALPIEEKRTLIDWVDGGAAAGSAPKSAAIAPPPPEWQLGKPSLILKSPKQVEVPATGKAFFADLELDPGLTRDAWVKAVEIHPQNTLVVHHVIVYVVREGQGTPDDGVGQDRADWGYLAAYTPGMGPMKFPEGYAKKLPARSRLVINVHYTPRGKVEIDRTTIGLYLSSLAPKHVLRTLPVRSIDFKIPPGAPSHHIIATRMLDRDIRILGSMPHAHYRGRSFRLRLLDPRDPKPRTLLSVPRYDFGWQFNYEFAKPELARKGSTLECDGIFDNSADNPRNPDPSQTVEFGESSTDEMHFCYVDYVDSR